MLFKKTILATTSILGISALSCGVLNTISCGSVSHKTTYTGDLSYFVLAVGNGEFTFLKMGNKAILMDAGCGISSENDVAINLNNPIQASHWGSADPIVYKNFMSAFFKTQGISEISAIFISHNHDDHYSELFNILKDENIDVKNIVLPINYDDAKKGISQISSFKGKVWDNWGQWYNFNGIWFENVTSVLSHDLVKKRVDPNDTSMILRFTVDNKTFLFTGDATKWIGSQLLNTNKKEIAQDVDILIAPHHGSSNSMTNVFDQLGKHVKHVFISGTGNTDQWRNNSGGHDFPTGEELSKVSELEPENVWLTGDLYSTGYDPQEYPDISNVVSDINHSYEYKITKLTNGSFGDQLIEHDEIIINY